MPRWQVWVAAATSIAGSFLLGSAAPATPPVGETIALANWPGQGGHDRPQSIEIRVSTAGLLFPGARRKISLTVINPNPFAVRIRSIRGKIKSVSRSGCRPTAANLEIRPYTGRLPLTVPARSRRDAGRLDLHMPNSVIDACQGARFVIRVEADAARDDR